MKRASQTRSISAAIAAMSLAVVLHAEPGQNPEGAQQFLAQVFSKQGSSLEIQYRQSGWNSMSGKWEKCADERYYSCGLNGGCLQEVCRETDYGSGYRVAPYTITAASAVDDNVCKSSFPVTAPWGGTRETWESGTKYKVTPNIASGPFDIDWANVASVEDKDGYVYVISSSGDQYNLRFKLPAENLRVRVATAMEFLRVKCDTTAATGF